MLGLAWSTPACCCAGGGLPYPSAGPPGTIKGSIDFAGAASPGALTVYAIDTRFRRLELKYLMARVPAGQTSYEISVPPGYYTVVARLDDDPASGAGHLRTIQCPTPGFEPDCGQPNLPPVRVDSQKPTPGVDIAGWGNPYAMYVIRNIDLYGTEIGSTPPLPPNFLHVSIDASQEALSQRVDTGIGVEVDLPSTWFAVQVPIIDRSISENGAERYFANENVRSPLALDSNGVWLSVIWDDTVPCTFPSPRSISADVYILRPGTAEWFYFGEPDGATLTQPFKGFSLMGGFTMIPQKCMDFVFETRTSGAREANLQLMKAIVQQAHPT